MTPSVRRPSSVVSGFQWFVVKVHSGREEVVKAALERRLRVEGLDAAICRILIPVEKVVELRKGRRVERTRKLFSGYLLCELALDDQLLALFREIPGISDFIRSGSVPVPLSSAEADRLVAEQLEEKEHVLLPEFDPGDQVRILRGTFAQTEGEVAEVLPNTGQVRVRVTILGRPVLLDLEPFEILQLRGRD